ncbi:hypothetical protein IWQ54_003860 [Labrenzia sp. EL_195]|nr:hypothetical protein [Labrenzia sp. EL_195]
MNLVSNGVSRHLRPLRETWPKQAFEAFIGWPVTIRTVGKFFLTAIDHAASGRERGGAFVPSTARS